MLRLLALTPTQAALGLACVASLVAPAALAQQAAPLTLDEALSRAVLSDPGLRAAGAGIDSARSGIRQARARPNPELSTEIENFSGKGSLRGFQGAESTFKLSQEIELGGQRKARIFLADRELHGAELAQVLRGLDLLRDVQLAYFDALAAEEIVAIAREKLKTAQALSASVKRRVAAARDPLMAGARAEAGLAEARIALAGALAEAATARASLASYWSGDEAFTLVRATFALPAALDHDHALISDQSPDLAKLNAERQRAEAAAKLERSQAYQNPTLSLGYRRFEERNGDGALVASLSIPLGVFDRNQGAIARANSEVRRVEYEIEAGRRTIMREFASLQRAIARDADVVRATEEDVIPQAERALALAQDGYNQGAFSYLDVLEAQRALSDARQRRVEALRSYHNNEAALDRLTARFAKTLPGKEIHQ